MNTITTKKLLGFYVYLLCWLCSGIADARQRNAFTKRNSISHHRVSTFKYYDKNEYEPGNVYRRQEVIHPIDEDSGNNKSTDDDIEKYGKTIDSTGAMLKSDVSKQRKNEVSTKDIIAKIKEIQDKIFKRTGSKELEARLKQMNPRGIPEALVPEKPIQVSGDRRKIIPEDVVDKILEKFQQLRSEAKHIVLSGDDQAKQNKEKPSVAEGSQRKLDTAPESPYASIGPPKESLEIKNRTEKANDVAALGTDGTPEPVVNNHDIQIPIGSTSSDLKNNDKPLSQGIPLMFVKNGENLIPVFSPGQAGQQAPVSITGQGSVKFNTNPGVALPPALNNVVPMNNGGNPLASFMSGDLEAGKNIQSPPVIDASQLAALQSQTSTRCSVPGPDCTQQPVQDVPNFGPGQETMELLNRLLHAPGFPQLASHLLGENMGGTLSNAPHLESHFQENPSELNLPDPHLASHFMEENMPQSNSASSNFFRDNASPGQFNMAGASQYYNPMIPPQSGESRALNSLTSGAHNRMEFPMASNDVHGTNPASIQFGLKQNLASSFPGTPSMLQHEENFGQTDHNEEVRHFLDSLPHIDPAGPAQPSELDSPSPTKQLFNQYNSRMFREHTINDISDPLDNQMNSQFGEKSPDELLEFAKYRSLTAPESQPTGDMSKPFFGGKEKYASNSDDKMMDPSNLLDELHNTQLKNRLAGAGDPTNSNDLASYHEYEEDKDYNREQGYGKNNFPEPAPDDLLDRLRHFDQNIQNSEPGAARHRIPAGKFGSMDPSFADEIRTNDGNIQSFDVERKDIATEHNSNNKLLTRRQPVHRHGDISVLSDDMLQYKHGRLSMDSDDVLNSFKKEQSYSRNSIGRPRHHRHRGRYARTYIPPQMRGVIGRPNPDSSTSDVELRVNGALITDNTSLRSTIVDGKIHPGKGKTFASKDPVQIELSHGDDKRKIINIITKGRYNITQNASSKRTKIPQLNLIT